MCERLLNLQEIYVSGQNICIEVYGNSVGTITPYEKRIEFRHKLVAHSSKHNKAYFIYVRYAS